LDDREQLIGKDMEGSGGGLIYGTILVNEIDEFQSERRQYTLDCAVIVIDQCPSDRRQYTL
jgi:hypothetical protein